MISPYRTATVTQLFSKMQALERELDIRTLRRGISRIFAREQRIRPGFASSWVIPNPPPNAKLLREYWVEDAKVSLYDLADETGALYHIAPFEYSLPPEQMRLIELARQELTEHYPRTLQLKRPEQAKMYVERYSMRRIYRLAKQHNVTLGRNRVEEVNRVKKLSAILAKYTAGLGITEIFLSDHHVQDVYIDAPVSQNLVHVVLGGQVDERIAGKCVTNVILSENDAESLLSRLRYESGRPFSEAMPLLECDISGFNTRATVIGAPLSPEGIAFALRRHATEPWTLLRLMSVRSLTPLAAGLLSFLIDGNATMLIAGARSAGKTALLGALMFEFPQSQRIISIEDTRELPCVELQALGYKIQSMVVQSAVGGIGELTANEALKIALRLGESALIIGEVRGEETKTLYEAMRAGTAGSSVLGTFHANSARAVFERVVHDIGIPPKSFNATDVVVVASFTRPSGIQRQIRRVTQIAELKKDAEEEGVFEDLMTYDEAHDMLVETDVFRHTSDKIGEIARSWGLTREDALDNIIARATIRKITVDYALRHNNMKLLSPSWVSKLNTSFWALVERQHRQYGRVDHRLLIEDWKKWFGKNVEYA